MLQCFQRPQSSDLIMLGTPRFKQAPLSNADGADIVFDIGNLHPSRQGIHQNAFKILSVRFIRPLGNGV